MQLRRIEISAYRCFKNSVVIDDIGDGVTLLVGDNEVGKSTVLAALQTVLFEKHSVGGAVADAMLPFGSKVRPKITLEFDHDGIHYRLHKAFCQKPEAYLEAESGGRWSGDAAEERLREMLEFTPPGKGGSKPHHRGLQALFWVEQGAAYGQPHINETAQTNLAGALEAEVGTVTGGERGRPLIKRIEHRVSEILTPRTKKPAGAYKDVINRVAEVHGRCDDLTEKLKDFEGKVDVLTQERVRLAKLEADDPIGEADKRLEKAKDAVREIDGLESSLKTAELNHGKALIEHKLAKSGFDDRLRKRKEVDAAAQDVTELKAEESAAQEYLNIAQKAFSDAEDAHRNAKTSLEDAQKDAVSAKRLADLLRKSEELDVAQRRLEKAVKDDQKATTLTARADANPFRPKVLDELRRLDGEVRDAETRLQAIATSLELLPNKGRHATTDGKKIDEKTITLTKPTRIKLDGYGAIQVTPGGEDIASRREEAVTAATKLKYELESRGAVSLQDAVQQGDARLSWLNDAKIHRSNVEAHAPEGLEALRRVVAGLEAEVDRLKKDLGDTEVPTIKADKAADRADELARKLKDAEAKERSASDELKDAAVALQNAKKSYAEATDRRKKAEEESKAIRNELDQSMKRDSDEDLETVLQDATKAVEDASKEAGEIERRLAESDPEGARQELKAATEARSKVEQNLQDLRRKVRDFEVELQTLGQGDIAAELEVAKGNLDRAQAEETRLKHEVSAMVLLLETLIGAEQVARETFLGPVRKRVEPYLRRLFPGSELVLNDQTLEITHLRRNGQDEPYERLSIGTREQLAVLARLAFADLLNEHGKQSPVILDDALVFSDDSRFEEMQWILDRAAERLQIIVLTCHERAYFGRGWATKRLQECKGLIWNSADHEEN